MLYIDLQFQIAVVQIARVSDCAGQVFSSRLLRADWARLSCGFF
ncbi:hypothetical protein PS843_01460 [Pseudomonas fluorescens]|nr:hypothetical protein PS843_01460 [Pseudomonas fluorescens]